jgi:hypothetical protein
MAHGRPKTFEQIGFGVTGAMPSTGKAGKSP